MIYVSYLVGVAPKHCFYRIFQRWGRPPLIYKYTDIHIYLDKKLMVDDGWIFCPEQNMYLFLGVIYRQRGWSLNVINTNYRFDGSSLKGFIVYTRICIYVYIHTLLVQASVSISIYSKLCAGWHLWVFQGHINTTNEALEMAQSARELCKEAEDDELLRAEAVSLLRMAGAQAQLEVGAR